MKARATHLGAVCLVLGLAAPLPARAGTDVWHSTAWVRYGPATRPAYRPAREPVRLRVQPGGTASFQVVFPRGRAGETTVDVVPPEGPGAAFPDGAVRLFTLEACIPGYPPDCLVPADPGRPLAPPLDPDARWRTVWVDLWVPPDQPPGTYRGALFIRRGAAGPVRVAVELRVGSPGARHRRGLRLDLNNYGVNFVRAWGLEPGRPESLEAVWAVYRLARQHRATFNPLPYKSQRGVPRPGMAPRLQGRGAALRVADWTAYDRFYGPLLDGSVFADGRPLDHQYLPFNPEWPSDFANYFDDRQRYEAEWTAVAREFVRHFQQKGWTRTTYQVFMNQKPRPNNRIPWNLDEPKGDRDYRALRYYADLTHRAFQNSGPVDVRFRIDISHFYCDKHRGNRLKDFRVSRGWQLLAPAVDTWVISTHSLEGRTAVKKAQELRRSGRRVYVYTSAPALDRPLADSVRLVERACAMGVDGIVFWNSVYAGGPVDRRGTDFLVYADPRFPGTPLASVRLRAVSAALGSVAGSCGVRSD